MKNNIYRISRNHSNGLNIWGIDFLVLPRRALNHEKNEKKKIKNKYNAGPL